MRNNGVISDWQTDPAPNGQIACSDCDPSAPFFGFDLSNVDNQNLRNTISNGGGIGTRVTFVPAGNRATHILPS